MTKKVLSLIIAAILLFSALPMTAFATEADIAETGALGTDGSYSYKFLDDGTVGIYEYIGSPTNLIIPATLGGYQVTAICSGAFEKCDTLESVTIANNVKTIEMEAFKSSSLKKLIIDDSVERICQNAFELCTKLENVELGNSVSTIERWAFRYCYNLKSITIPDSVIDLQSDTFFQCTKLEDVIIGNGVKSIGNSTFYGCSKLQSIIIGNSVTEIGEYAFASCSSLESVTIPDSVTSIKKGAFNNCTSLKSLVINGALEDVEYNSFYGLTSLENISVSDQFTGCGCIFNNTAWWDNQPDGAVYIDHLLYSYKGDCPSTTELVIKEGTLHINEQAFYCRDLKSVVIPDSVTTIGNSAFEGCLYLEEVTLGNAVKTIGDHAFYDCTSLHCVKIPASVEEIDQLAIGFYKEYYDNYWSWKNSRVSPFTINGYENTAAQRYANDNGFTFIPIGDEPAPILGDADGSGEVDMTDATVIQRVVTMIAVPYDEEQLMRADVDGDGELTVVDATFIQRYSTKVQTPYPIGEEI